jgi:hypothetical protein
MPPVFGLRPRQARRREKDSSGGDPHTRRKIFANTCRLSGPPVPVSWRPYSPDDSHRPDHQVAGVFPLTDITARGCADMFIEGWVARYGTPAIVTTDRGAQFSSQVWQTMCKTLGVTHITTSAYHPCSNGLVEWLHRQIKEALRFRE